MTKARSPKALPPLPPPADPTRLNQDWRCPGCPEPIPKGTPLVTILWDQRERSWRHLKCRREPENRREAVQYRNVAENDCYRELTTRGIDPHRAGYADFWWVTGGRLCFCEVKSSSFELLKRDQLDFLTAARRHGCGVYRYAPQTGLVEVTDDEP